MDLDALLQRDTLDALEAECPGAVNILARMPPQMLVRISWGTCGAAPPG